MFGDSSERTGAHCGVVKLGSSSPVFFIFSFILEFFPQFKNGEKKKVSPFCLFYFDPFRKQWRY